MEDPSQKQRALIVIIDGLGGIPGESALKDARCKFMDKLASEGRTGMFYALGKGVVPGSDTSHLALLGYGLDEYPGRGPIEALGAGLKLRKGDVAFRTNFARVSRGKVVDRRAGRISTEEAKRLAKLIARKRIGKLEFIFKSTVDHRGVLVIRGGADDNIEGNDPHKTGAPLKECRARTTSAKRTAEALNEYLSWVQERLKGRKANALLVRGAGKFKKLEDFSKRQGVSAEFIAGGAMYKGVARIVGIPAPDIEGATGSADTDLGAKAKAAINSKADIVFIHVKAADNFGHDGNIKGKARMLERIDKELVSRVAKHFDAICITGDHATPCKLKRHSGHGAPLFAWGRSVGRDGSKRFEEVECSRGSLGALFGSDVLNLAKDWIGKSRKVGS